MEDKLRKLYNTLLIIETKGESTLAMADCLRYVNNLIVEANVEANKPVAEVVE